MIWLRLFWIEAVVLPAAGLWVLAGRAAGSPYRLLNLVVLSVALAVGLAGLIYSESRRARGGTENGPSTH